MSNAIIRTFCWHHWDKWSEPFQGEWIHREVMGNVETNETVVKYMSQRRMCESCGKVVYRKCT